MNPLIPSPADIPPLPKAPLLELLLLENPLPLAAVIAFLGLIAAITLLRTAKPKPAAITAAATAALLTALLALAHNTVTPREQVKALTTELVEAVTTFNAAEMTRLLWQDVRVEGSGVPIIESRDAILRTTERVLATNYRVASADVLETRAALDNPQTARVQVRVRAFAEGWNAPNASWWQITWRRDAGKWVATKIEALWIQGVG